MNKKEIQELIFTILKDQNFDFKSYPDLWVNYYCDEVLTIVLKDYYPYNFCPFFDTKNLDLDYEIIQIFVNYFLKLFKINNFKEDEIINLNGYNRTKFQNLIDQYYFEMFGEENKMIHAYPFSNILLFETNNSYIIIKAPLSEIQLEEYIKLLRIYEKCIEKKLKN